MSGLLSGLPQGTTPQGLEATLEGSSLPPQEKTTLQQILKSFGGSNGQTFGTPGGPSYAGTQATFNPYAGGPGTNPYNTSSTPISAGTV